MFNDYFYSVFTQAATNQSLPIENSSHLSSIEEDVYNALINLDTSKAMGPDGIFPIVLSKDASVLYRPFHYLLNQARAGRRPARTWFLEIAFVREVRSYAWMCVCVCSPPRP